MDWNNLVKSLRSDLNHLYDPTHLRKSALVDLLGLDKQIDAGFALQRVLISEIEKLKELKDTGQLNNELTYELLQQRYVFQVPQTELAAIFSMSVRHLRREQSVAIEFLATRLYHQFDSSLHSNNEASTKEDENINGNPDLRWITQNTGGAACDPNPIFIEVVDLIQPLLDKDQVLVDIDIDGPVPFVAVHPVALKQTLLTLLNAALNWHPRSGVSLKVNHSTEVVIEILADSTSAMIQSDLMHLDSFPMMVADELLNPFKAEVHLIHDEHYLGYQLCLPILLQIPVMVIDDNSDFFQLLQRYTAGTRYTIFGINNIGNFMSEIITRKPAIILIDLMMPIMDGWELFEQIRGNSETWSIPVVITSVLPQGELAKAKGANDFLQKPISREPFLSALDHLIMVQ